LTVRPTGNAPAIAILAKHEHEVSILLVFDALQHIVAEAAEAEQYQRNVAGDRSR
jgi:hypothetical protein